MSEMDRAYVSQCHGPGPNLQIHQPYPTSGKLSGRCCWSLGISKGAGRRGDALVRGGAGFYHDMGGWGSA